MGIKHFFTTFADNVNIDTSPLPDPSSNRAALTDIFNVVFGVMAAIAVLIIVIAGVKFIWSRGDAQATAKARNAIVYAALGLVVIMLAYAIVTFVLNILGG